jgi:hypothetical protein
MAARRCEAAPKADPRGRWRQHALIRVNAPDYERRSGDGQQEKSRENGGSRKTDAERRGSRCSAGWDAGIKIGRRIR